MEQYETRYFCFKLKPQKFNLEIGCVFLIIPFSLALYCVDGFVSIGKKINSVWRLSEDSLVQKYFKNLKQELIQEKPRTVSVLGGQTVLAFKIEKGVLQKCFHFYVYYFYDEITWFSYLLALQFLESSANMFAAAQQLSQNINPGESFYVIVLVAMAAEHSLQFWSRILPGRLLGLKHHFH